MATRACTFGLLSLALFRAHGAASDPTSQKARDLCGQTCSAGFPPHLGWGRSRAGSRAAVLGLVLLGMLVDSAETSHDWDEAASSPHQGAAVFAACALDMAAEAMAGGGVECAAGVEMLGWLCFAAWACAVWCCRSGRHAMQCARVAGAKHCSGATQAVRLGEGWPVRRC